MYDIVIYEFEDLEICERFDEEYLKGKCVGDGTLFFWETFLNRNNRELTTIISDESSYIPFRSILRPLLKKISLEIIKELKEK